MSVCAECHEFINKLEEFNERCEKVDKLFKKLLSSDENILTDENLKELRRQTGLNDEEV